MAKERLKKETAIQQQGKCNLTGKDLPTETKRFDTHREIPKRDGGDYRPDNTTVVLPTAHMAEHHTLRIRPKVLEELKTIIDDRQQVIKVQSKVNNQLSAYERCRGTDHSNPKTVAFLNDMLVKAKQALTATDKRLLKAEALTTNLARSALGVRGIGPVTVAYCMAYIDLPGFYPPDHPKYPNKEKCRHASSLWKYVGLDKPSHERFTKGEAGGGNVNLRTILRTMADSQIKAVGSVLESEIDPALVAILITHGIIRRKEKKKKEAPDKVTFNDVLGTREQLEDRLDYIVGLDKTPVMAIWDKLSRGAYRHLYYERKHRLENSSAMVTTRNNQGHQIVCEWKDAMACHRHGAAIRAIMKTFLVDYYIVGRTILGLNVTSTYAEAILKSGHRTTQPQERGWIY